MCQEGDIFLRELNQYFLLLISRFSFNFLQVNFSDKPDNVTTLIRTTPSNLIDREHLSRMMNHSTFLHKEVEDTLISSETSNLFSTLNDYSTDSVIDHFQSFASIHLHLCYFCFSQNHSSCWVDIGWSSSLCCIETFSCA